MIPLHALLLYLGIYAVLIAIPGPNVIAIVARALAGGFRAAVPASFGTAVGDIFLMSLSVLGLSIIARAPPAIFAGVKIAGVIYLIWIGVKYWRARTGEMAAGSADRTRGFLAQLAVTAGNPKGIAFFFAVLPATIDLKQLEFAGYLQLAAATLVLIPAITLIYAAAAARARHLLASRRARQQLNRGAGLTMIGAAFAIAVSG